jgi:hypothetical protein
VAAHRPGGIFFLAVFAAVNFFFLVGEDKYLVEPLLHGGDAPRVLAADDVRHLLRQREDFFLNDDVALDDVDRDVVVDET